MLAHTFHVQDQKHNLTWAHLEGVLPYEIVLDRQNLLVKAVDKTSTVITLLAKITYDHKTTMRLLHFDFVSRTVVTEVTDTVAWSAKYGPIMWEQVEEIVCNKYIVKRNSLFLKCVFRRDKEVMFLEEIDGKRIFTFCNTCDRTVARHTLN